MRSLLNYLNKEIKQYNELVLINISINLVFILISCEVSKNAYHLLTDCSRKEIRGKCS